MANVRKRILELTPLPSASLDTTIVGVDGGTTYRIELDVLADAVTSRVNILDRDRLASLESVTSSFESKGRSVISSSAQISAFGFISSSVTIPTGTISSSAQITSFGFISQSVDITSLNSFTSSQQTLNTAFTNGISARLQTSSFNDFSTSVDSRIIAATNEQSLTHLVNTSSFNEYTASISTGSLVNRLNAIESVSGSWITESETGSFLTNLNGAISSSSQLTSSFDTRYVISGSVGATPLGTISGSAQITEFGFISSSQTIDTSSLATTGSNTFIGTETISGSLLLSGSFSYNGTPLQNGFAFAQPIVSKIVSNASYTGAASWTGTYVSTGGAIIVRADVTGYRASVGTGTAVLYRDGVAVASHSFFFNQANVHATIPTITYVRNSETGSHTYAIGFTDIVADTNDYLTITVLEYGNSAILPATLISGSSQLTSSFDMRYVASGSISATPAGTISGSAQITTLGFVSGSYETTGRGIISSSANLVTTSSYNADSASFDSRINSIVTESGSNLTYFLEAYANVTYTLPGGFTNDLCRYSVVSVTENVPSNWFNTSTYRFTPQKAGYWEIIASYDVYRNTEASMAIRKNGGIVASAGSFNAVAQDISKIIYLNGSTDYIDIVNTGGAALQRDQYQQRSWFQAKFVGNIDGSTDLLSSNNTFTGNNTFQGTTRFETVGGDEGGEIQFGVPVTNTTLQNRVTVDVWQNRLRFFEGSANANGVYIDLSKPTTGNNNEITYKASGLVNAGTFVTLDNIKATVTTSGQRGLSLATVSGSFACSIGGNYAGATVGASGFAGQATITTSASTSIFGWGFTTVGDMANYIITDTTNSRAYRIIIQIGNAFNNNLVSIERLH